MTVVDRRSIARIFSFGVAALLLGILSAPPATAAPAAKRGEACSKVGQQKDGLICKTVNGKKRWSFRSKSSEATVYTPWGSATLKPFVVPVKGCRDVPVEFAIDDITSMRVGIGVFIFQFAGDEVARLSVWKSEFTDFTVRKSIKVCAEATSERSAIRPNRQYNFEIGTDGGPFRSTFKTGE